VVFGNSDGQIWGVVQRAIRDAGFDSVPSHVAILDKGQRSVKGLNSGSEGVVTVDLIVTLQKPDRAVNRKVATHTQAEPDELIAEAIANLPVEQSRNPSHVYAAILRTAITRNQMVDRLHLSDVLIALRNAGYTIDRKTGLLARATDRTAVAAE
jgi:hypothetical protein